MLRFNGQAYIPEKISDSHIYIYMYMHMHIPSSSSVVMCVGLPLPTTSVNRTLVIEGKILLISGTRWRGLPLWEATLRMSLSVR